MTTEPAQGVDPRSPVLLALSSEQRAALAPELARLERPGIELVFEESPSVALDLVKKIGPPLVIVGMTIGTMEGLEFLALLLKRLPSFRGKVVVLPDKGDPFPPMLQGRDPATGKATTEAIDFTGIERLVEALARDKNPEPAPANAAAAPPSPAPSPEVSPAPEIAGVSPSATASATDRMPAGLAESESLPRAMASSPIEPAPRTRTRGPILALAALVVLGALAAIAPLVSRAHPPPPVTMPTVEPTSARAAPPQGEASPPPQTHTSGVAPSGADKGAAARGDPSLEQLTTLPLSFAKSSTEFEVTSAEGLDAIVSAIKRDLRDGRLEVGGHTSEEGPERFNQELSQGRAASVKRYLVGRGVPESHILLKAYQASGATGSARPEANRRVTVRMLP